MTLHAPSAATPSGADPGRQVAQLREALALVERIGGIAAGDPSREAWLDEAARLSSDYERALPILQRRFDALAAETAGWAAAGVEALLVGGGAQPPQAAAARLARRLDRAIRELTELLAR